MRTYLGELYAQRRLADYYDPDSGRGHLLAAAADVYASPEAQTDRRLGPPVRRDLRQARPRPA